MERRRGRRGWPGRAHGCPVQFLWTRCMTLILLRHERLATFRDTERGNVMRHENSVFHQLLNQMPWVEFDRLVKEHGSDFRIRELTTKSQFVALLYGQLSGATSLRAIVSGLAS